MVCGDSEGFQSIRMGRTKGILRSLERGANKTDRIHRVITDRQIPITKSQIPNKSQLTNVQITKQYIWLSQILEFR